MTEAALCPSRYLSHVAGAELHLAAFDIDGTLRTARDPWIHLHEFLGFGDQAKHHKELFFSRQITDEEWAVRDAALWKGFHRDKILQALDTNPLKPGAQTLLEWFGARRIPIIGVSSGLSIFNDGLARRFGFRLMRSNELVFDDKGVCTGLVRINVHEDGKGEVLTQCLKELAVHPKNVVAFGDGSADIEMFRLVGLSIAVSPSKPTIKDAAHHCIQEGSLEPAITFIEQHFSVTPPLPSWLVGSRHHSHLPFPGKACLAKKRL